MEANEILKIATSVGATFCALSPMLYFSHVEKRFRWYHWFLALIIGASGGPLIGTAVTTFLIRH